MQPIELSGGEALARALRAQGVPFVFGIAGGKLGHFMRAIGDDPTISYVGTRHEATAAHMASAIYARSGAICVAMAEAGPGGAYLASGTAHAFNNNLAMLALTSNNQHAASYPGRGMFMEQDNAALFSHVTKWNAAVHDGARIPELVREACRHALTGRPGPVHLDLPQDVLARRYRYDSGAFEAPAARGRPRGDAALIEAAASMLQTAERPLLIAGGGVVRSGATAAFRALGNRLGAAITATQMGLGAAPDDVPGFAGHGGVIGGTALVEALQQADVVFAIGCRFSSWLWNREGALVRPPQRLIQADIDPAMLGRAAEIEIGIEGDARAVIEDILAALPQTTSPAEREREAAGRVRAPGQEPNPEQHATARAAWRTLCENRRTKDRAQLAALADDTALPMHPAALARAVGATLPVDALICYDGGHTSFWSNDFCAAREPATRLHDPGLAQLGFGLPYAIALKLHEPGRMVVNITGDGAFGFTLAELDTARRYGAPVINVIHNNAAWGVIARSQSMQHFALGCDLAGTDYAAIARGFGCHGETVSTPADFAPAFARAAASGLPAVLDCLTRFESHPAMPHFGRMGSYGMTEH